jgi:hypothetical protein
VSDVSYEFFLAEDAVNKLNDGPYAAVLRRAIVIVCESVADKQSAAWQDRIWVSKLVEKSNNWLVDKISSINCRGERLQGVVGDIVTFTATYSHTSLALGLQEIYIQFEEVQQAYTKNFTSLQERLEELGEDFGFVEEDIANITTNLPGVFTQVQALWGRVGALELSQAPRPLSGGGLTKASLILDDSTGVPIASLGQMFQKLAILEKENATMRAEIDGEAARKIVRSFHKPVCSSYTDGKEALPGSSIVAFKTSSQWLGELGRDGRRHKVEDKINTAKIAVIANINAKLPSGSVL